MHVRAGDGNVRSGATRRLRTGKRRHGGTATKKRSKRVGGYRRVRISPISPSIVSNRNVSETDSATANSIAPDALPSFLPLLLELRADLRTIENAIDAYEQASFRRDWTGVDVHRQQARAVATIQKRLQKACDRLDILPQERQRLQHQIFKLRADLLAARTPAR